MRWLGTGAFAALVAATTPAPAQVFQTDAAKTPLPQPVGPAELDLVDNSWGWNATSTSWKDPTGAQLTTPLVYGTFYSPPTYPQFVTGDAITLGGLFKWRHEAIDPVKDAKTGPGYFSAKCGFSGQLLLMGGNCQVEFGWYNVTDPNSTTPPAAADIHSFIPTPLTSLNCVQEDGKTPKTDGFCPLAWDNLNPRDLSIKRWIPTTFSSGDISKNPAYVGPYVGFAVIGGSAGKCTQNKYSMSAYNQKNPSGTPWVTTLIYQSKVDPSGFYMAFEDLPMPQTDWKASGCDGDFNDFVFYVSGLTCSGGNTPCDTKLQGACSVGRTDCAAEGETPACRPVIQPGTEICDNVDNDCNGIVDDGASLCPNADKPICFQGSCVGNCNKGEFPCPPGTACDDSGHCVDPACATVNCAAGTACRGGTCVDPCANTACPYGTQCELGTCVDPCAGVTCPADRVCSKGLCVGKCDCTGCEAGLTCAADGRCVDTACATVTCMSGTVCRMGTCTDPCMGVVCPGGGVCSSITGTCSAPMSGSGGSADVIGIDSGGTQGLNFNTGGTATTGTGTTGMRRSLSGGPTAKGCGCRIAEVERERSSALGWLSAAFGLGIWIRRQRSARVASATRQRKPAA